MNNAFLVKAEKYLDANRILHQLSSMIHTPGYKGHDRKRQLEGLNW
jgi:hypothetical protein